LIGAWMSLSEHDLLELWAMAETQHPIDRALTALSLGERTRRGALAELPIGERDARLFELYRGLAGDHIAVIARCPACGEASELTVSAAALSPGRDRSGEAAEIIVEHAGAVVRCRQPTSRALAAAAMAPDEASARAGLIAATVVSAHAGEVALDPGDLDDELIGRIEDALAEMVPPAELLLGVTCAGCGNAWSAPFDIGEVVWTAVELAARRAMDGVVELGRAYGWTEEAVLALPPARRRYYQERA
jgi:hypothetical protein